MRAREFLLTAGVLFAGLPTLGPVALAQERAPPTRESELIRSPDGAIEVRPERPRARLGLYLYASCALTDASAVCDRPPVVMSVVEDGPADRAGVRVRDTLIALDGQQLATPEGRRALQVLEPGSSVVLSLSGPDGRREVAVVPEIRAPVHVMRFEWKPPDLEGTGGQVRMFRFPSPEAVAELEIRLDSISEAGSENAFVLFGPDEDGQLRLEIVGIDPGTVRSRVRTEAPNPAAAWVVESRELAKRLEEVRERTLRIARVQLDSLVRLQSTVEGVVVAPRQSRELDRLLTPGAAEAPAGFVRLRTAPGVEPLLASSRRLAGAEFRMLTPELAEYFEGVERGLLVLRVIPNTPAGQLGLRGGDVVIECGGSPVHTIEAFRAAISGTNDAGVAVKWIRKGAEASGRLSAP